MADSSKLALNDLTEHELLSKGQDLRRKLFEARLQKATARLEKPHIIKALRRDIARCETELTRLRSNK